MIHFQEELNEFLQSRPYREITVDGARFKYILSGEAGKQAIVFFNGLNMQEAWIRYVKAFEADYRVLMIEYPVCYRSNLALLDGIATLLAALGIDRPIIVGASDGGLLGQLYVRRFPKNIRALILMTTVTLDSSYVEDMKKKLSLMPLMKGSLRLMPYSLLKKRLLGQVYGYFTDETEEEQTYGRSFFEVIASDPYYKQKFLNAFGLVDETPKLEPFRTEEFAGLKDNILLLHPDKDIFTKEDQEKLTELLPSAEVHSMSGGHLGFVVCAGKYIEIIRAFLKKAGLS